MRDAYWMLKVFTFLILIAFCFFAFPLILVFLGFIIGAISIFFDASPIIGEVIIKIGTVFWRHILLTLLGIILVAVGFSFLTDRVHRLGRFRKIKYLKKKS